MADTDIILAAMEEAAMPVLVKPMAPSTTGTVPTANTVGKKRLRLAPWDRLLQVSLSSSWGMTFGSALLL